MQSPDVLLNNARNALQQHSYTDAVMYIRAVLDIDPKNPEANHMMGIVLSRAGRRNEACMYFEIAAQECENDIQIYYNYATVLYLCAKYHKAVPYFEKVLAINPDHTGALNNYSSLLNVLGDNEKAEALVRKLLVLDPHSAVVLTNLGNILKDQGHIEEAAACYKKAISVKPDYIIAYSNLLLSLNYFCESPCELFKEHLQYEKVIFSFVEKNTYTSSVIQLHKTPLRVGYVSGDFKAHSVSFFMEPILQNHNHEQFEIFCYSDVSNPDCFTQRMQKTVTQWRTITTLNNTQAAKLVNNDAIDILVDLAGHAGNDRLPVFVMKPAPVQVTYLGYPNTTGLSTIDYRITDQWADPTGHEQYYTEKLYRLAEGFLCYKPYNNAPPVSDLPVKTNRYITFGSFNNFPKISSMTIKLWAHILQKVPHSKLFLKTKPLNACSVQKRVLEQFAHYGISDNRLILSGHSGSFEEHLREYHKVDIALDPYPYHGTTTTCEALWMGVPVITLAGARHASLVGVSILHSIGLTGMIAYTPQQYISIASFLAGNIDALTKLRSGLRQIMATAPLCNAKSFTKNLESAYREMWKSNASIGL